MTNSNQKERFRTRIAMQEQNITVLQNKCEEYLAELDRTRKALDKAIWWLNEIVENHRYTPISTAEKALAEIKQITETKE